MEQKKKFDLNTVIGFGLIFVIIVWMSYKNQNDSVKEDAKAKTEKAAQAKPAKTNTAEIAPAVTDTATADLFKNSKA